MASFRAGLILESALANGWEPGPDFTEEETALITKDLTAIARRLVRNGGREPDF